MKRYTTLDIARAYAAQLITDRSLVAWAQENFGRPFGVSIGVDYRDLPGLNEAPFLVIIPRSLDSGPQRLNNAHKLGLIAGIEDEEMAEVNGIKEMRGLVRLSGELMPLLEHCLDLALPKARLQEISTDYSTQEFPLLELFVDVTVEQTLPIGGRHI